MAFDLPRLQDHVIGILKGTWDLAAPCLRPPPSGTAFPPAVRSTFPSTFGRQEVKEARRILGCFRSMANWPMFRKTLGGG